MLRWFLADLRTGRQILDLPILSGRWERFLNAPESIEATLNMWDPDTIALYPRNSAAPGRTILAVASGDTVLAAGPIWAHDYDRARGMLRLIGKGAWSYYDHRFVLPVVAATVDVTTFTLPDPSAAGKTMPNPALGTYLNGLELGTIAKRWVQQAHAWTNGSLPVVFEDDRIAPSDEGHERNFEGSQFKRLGDVLEQLTAVEGGPDIIFQPRLTADRLGIEFALRTGTDAAPQIAGGPHVWNVTVPESSVSNFGVQLDASSMASVGWVTGGRSGDSVMVGRSTDPTLTDVGHPLFETMDSSHSSVSRQPTLDQYANEATVLGRGAVETMTFTVEADQQPFLGAFWEGDYCDVELARYGTRPYSVPLLEMDADGMFDPGSLPDTVDGFYSPVGLPMDEDGFYLTDEERFERMVGDPYLFEGGTFRRRITGIAGDERGLTVDVTCQPVRS